MSVQDPPRRRCIVADDHPAMLVATQAFLEAHEFDVVATASDGARAVAVAREHQPELALIDFRMPRLGGIELVAALAEAAPTARIVVYTGEPDERLVEQALTQKIAGIVLKEAPLIDLVRALEAAVTGRVYVDSGLASRPGTAENGRTTLTKREREVLSLLADGLGHEEIGARLGISAETVRTHVRKAGERLGAATRTQAVATALRLGLLT